MNINDTVVTLNNIVWGWPLILFVVFVSILSTIMLYGVQFRYFFDSWKLTFSFDKGHTAAVNSDMTPFQSFLNTLSTSVGNGSIAGIATAVYAGGPGSAFWVFAIGLLSMSVRFAEVYLSTYYMTNSPTGTSMGGPMIYLRKVPGGSFLPFLYSFFCLLLGLTSGNAMQANSIRVGIVRILPSVSPFAIALGLFAFITYVIVGGAQRIVAVSDKIVPVKVGLFFITAFIVLIAHYQAIVPALLLIYRSAFTMKAMAGGSVGYSIQQAMRYGMVRSINASEAGLGTAAVLFGGSGGKDPVANGIMAMLGTFMSANLVCFMVALMIVASGVWNSGQTGIDLTISAYETVFGVCGGWIVTFLSVSFGIGVMVSYAYIARACWIFLTNGRMVPLFSMLFCAATFFGAIGQVDVIWNSVDLVNAGLLISNLYGILYLLPIVRRGVKDYILHEQA